LGFSEENFDFFENKAGATEIATREALRIIEAWVLKLAPKAVIEIGSGIGTITRLVCMAAGPNAKIIAYEKNDWCRKRFWENVHFTNVELCENLLDLYRLQSINIDLIIVDDFLNKSETNQLVVKFEPKIIFIEGHRRMQQLYFAKSLHESGMSFKYKNHSKTEDSYKGGVSFVTFQYSDYMNYSGLSNYFLVLARIGFGLFTSKIFETRSKVSFRAIVKRLWIKGKDELQ